MLDQESHEIQRMLEVGRVVLVAHLMPSMVVSDDGLVLHNEIQ